jgi:hypothetical protein
LFRVFTWSISARVIRTRVCGLSDKPDSVPASPSPVNAPASPAPTGQPAQLVPTQIHRARYRGRSEPARQERCDRGPEFIRHGHAVLHSVPAAPPTSPVGDDAYSVVGMSSTAWKRALRVMTVSSSAAHRSGRFAVSRSP